MGPDARGDGAREVTSSASGARELGERLRHVRIQQGRSLQDVEALSAGELKASVVGAYERGERALSVRRLEQLATFYRVPVVELLPTTHRGRGRDRTPDDDLRVVIDLAELERHRDDEPALVRYVEAIRARRGDYGRVLTVRTADLDTLAALTDSSPGQLRARLVDSGIVR